MSKILVNISVPSTGESYEMYIPEDIKIASASRLMKNYLFDDSAYDTLTLCYSKDGSIIPANFFVYEAQIRNGDKLLLM